MSFFYWEDAGMSTMSGCRVVRSAKAEGCPMPDAYLNGRPVYFGDVAHGPEDSCDSFFESASYADDDTDLSDADLEALTAEHAEYLDAQWFEHQAMRAEYYRGD